MKKNESRPIYNANNKNIFIESALYWLQYSCLLSNNKLSYGKDEVFLYKKQIFVKEKTIISLFSHDRLYFHNNITISNIKDKGDSLHFETMQFIEKYLFEHYYQ